MIFRDVDVIQGMSAEAIDELLSIAQTVSQKKGDVLFKQGDPAEHLYVLESGAVELMLEGAGRTTHLAQNPGELLGWSSVVGRDAYSATALVAEPTRLIQFHRDKVEKVLRNHPASGMRFYKQLSREVGDRLIGCYRLLV
jgi:CRP-like cAMP-binding protein